MTQTIKTDLNKLLGSVTADIKKDFETSDFTQIGQFTFLSTGNPGINYAMSGRFDGGFPQGLITELYGENSCVCGNTLVEIEILD